MNEGYISKAQLLLQYYAAVGELMEEAGLDVTPAVMPKLNHEPAQFGRRIDVDTRVA